MTASSMLRSLAATTLVCLGGWVLAAEIKEPDERVVNALKDVQVLVGTWEGSGRSDKSGGWDEEVDCGWKFNTEKGRASLYFTFEDPKNKRRTDRILDEAMITYDPEADEYVLKAYLNAPGDKLVEFRGKPKSDTNLVLDRVGIGKKPADDYLDQLDIKVLNDGDRLVYVFKRRFGRSAYRGFATVGLDRQGASLAGAAASGPLCPVTGGKGTIPVSHNGVTYYVCCTGCKAMFEADPERYVAKLDD